MSNRNSRKNSETVSRIRASSLMPNDRIVLAGGTRRRVKFVHVFKGSNNWNNPGYMPKIVFGFVNDSGDDIQTRSYNYTQQVSVVETEKTRAARRAMSREMPASERLWS